MTLQERIARWGGAVCPCGAWADGHYLVQEQLVCDACHTRSLSPRQQLHWKNLTTTLK